MNLSGLLHILRGQEQYQNILGGLNTPTSNHNTLGLIRAARVYTLAALVEDTGRPTLVITAREDRAHHFAEQLVAWSPELRVLNYAEPTPIFYEHAPWGQEARRARLEVLSALMDDQPQDTVIVSSARALMQRTLSPEALRKSAIRIERNRPLPGGQIDHLLRRWVGAGYEPASLVVTAGQFSRRGGIIDVFPVTSSLPVRIELWGDEVESIRTFDPASQRSEESIESIIISPAREALPLYGGVVAEQLNGWFQQSVDEEEVSPKEGYRELEALTQGRAFPTLEFYLPYMTAEPISLLDYLPENCLIAVDDWGDLHGTIEELEHQALELREMHHRNEDIPEEMPLPFVTWDQLADDLSERGILELAGHPEEAPLADLFDPGPRFAGELKRVLDHLRDETRGMQDRAVVISRQASRLAELWNDHIRGDIVSTIEDLSDPPPPGKPSFVQGGLSDGWVMLTDEGTIHVYTDAEIFGWQRPEPRRRRRKAERTIVTEDFFAELGPGDIIVHVEYGIGRFEGLEKRILSGVEREFILLSYQGGDILYVPIYQADRITRFVGPSETPKLSRLGAAEWERTKSKARKAAEEIAEELLELYSARELVGGHAFNPDGAWQHELEASFPYIETDDQLRALEEVKADMEANRPMDRLICGDVGYGKTEVALRAAFKAVMDGKQVAMLVPTTVLAQQHYETFSRRLASFPVKVEMLSRFRTKAEQDQIVGALEDGQVDIVVGTHRLLSGDIIFNDLGLLVIDEEQRFGVTHKEHFKQLRTEVDVLTLTATPIPRTLYMSLTGVRDISLIQTAPGERLPVTTHVGRRDDDLIRQAVLRELDRGGQVFFVHNRVQTIYTQAEKLRKLIPEADIEVGHGQMGERELERIMNEFAEGTIQILVSTSIIEAGLDIPNANTLIVDRADYFGLSQLYQLRGRVGRSANRAFAYFFHPPIHKMSSDARMRLETIAEQTQLGAGMNIALRDMEIRGTGDILGARQSGQINAVGFHLYTRMLAQSVKRLRAEREGSKVAPMLKSEQLEELSLQETVTIDLPIPTYIPTDYVPELSLRIQLYRRMAEMMDDASIDALGSELADRFGPPPPPVENLLLQLRIKLLALEAGARAITTDSGQVCVRMDGLERINRQGLQARIGHEVRVSRTAVWLPRNAPDWQEMLIAVLGRIRDADVGGRVQEE